MKMKRGKFSTFLFSLIPGAGEMYLGFFKYGTSLMSLFIGSIICASIVFSPLLLIAFVVWFYSFFHTNNINHMPDYEFEQLEDTYLFSPFDHTSFSDFIHNNKALCAIACIFIGIIVLCYTFIDVFLLMIPDSFYYEISHILHTFLPKIFFGVICIFLGLFLIRGKKASLFQEFENDGDDDNDNGNIHSAYTEEIHSKWTEDFIKPNFFQKEEKTEENTTFEEEQQKKERNGKEESL